MSRLYRRPRRSIGDAASAGAAVVQEFNVGQYIPQSIQDDYATGKSYYDSFSTAAQGVSFRNGTVQLSPAAQQAATDGIVAGISAIAPELGVAYAAILAIGPHASAGPGVCAQSPPASPKLADLQAWQYFKSWSGFFGPYPAPAPNSFEAYANPILEYNWLLFANCFSDKSLPSQALLATLIASWNQTHAGPTRQICRAGLNPPTFSQGPGFDPIADALEAGLKLTCPTGPPIDSFGDTGPCTPFNVTSCFTINDGPIIVKPLTLHFPHPAVAAKAPSPIAPAPSSAGSATAGAVATVAALGLAAAAGLFVHRHPAALKKLRRRVRF